MFRFLTVSLLLVRRPCAPPNRAPATSASVRGHARSAQRDHRRRRRRPSARSRSSRTCPTAARCAPASPRSCRAARRRSTAAFSRGWFSLNGNGEMTGTDLDRGVRAARGPGAAHQHAQRRRRARRGDRVARASGAADASGYWWSLPVVAETWDGHLNDINGFHVQAEHVDARARRRAGRARGRRQRRRRHRHDLLRVQVRDRHRVARRRRADARLHASACWCRRTTASRAQPADRRRAGRPAPEHRPRRRRHPPTRQTGSIIIVVATDAPLLPHQLKRIGAAGAAGARADGQHARATAPATSSSPSRPRTAAPSAAATALAGGVPRQRPVGSAVPRDGAGHGGSDHERAGRGPRHAGHRGSFARPSITRRSSPCSSATGGQHAP